MKPAPEQAAAPPAAEEAALPRPSESEVAAVVEALLFATTTPLTLKRLSALMGDTPGDVVEAAIGDLRERYDRSRSGLMVMEVAGGFQIASRPEVADWVLALHRHRRKNPISPALMETLSIVAYKQPIVRAEIESIRGVDCGGVLRALQDAGLVEVVGQKEVPGRPSLYGTSESFLKTFGLRDLNELPSLEELQHILSAPMKAPEAPAAEPAPTVEDAGAPPDAPDEPEAS